MTNQILERSALPEQDCWAIHDIYRTDEDWEADFKRAGRGFFVSAVKVQCAFKKMNQAVIFLLTEKRGRIFVPDGMEPHGIAKDQRNPAFVTVRITNYKVAYPVTYKVDIGSVAGTPGGTAGIVGMIPANGIQIIS